MQKTVRTPLLAASSLLIFATILLTPMPAVAFASASPMVGLFVVDDGQGGTTVSFTPPTHDVQEVRAYSTGGRPACASTPAASACSERVLGEVPLGQDITLAGAAGLNLWLRNDAGVPLLLRDLKVALVRVMADGERDLVVFVLADPQGNRMGQNSVEARTSASPPIVLEDAPVELRLGAVAAGAAPSALEGERLRLVVRSIATQSASVDADGVPPVDAGLLLQFGRQAPSGVLFPVESIQFVHQHMRLGTATLGVYLAAGNNISLQAPTEGPTLTQTVSGADPMEPEEYEWGVTVLDETVKFVGDGVFTIDVRLPAPATGAALAPRLGIEVAMYVNGTRYSSSTPESVVVAAAAQGGASPVQRFVGTLPLNNVTATEGTNLSIALSLYATAGGGNYEVLFGSGDAASGVLIPTLGGGLKLPKPPAALLPSNETNESEPAPSQSPEPSASATRPPDPSPPGTTPATSEASAEAASESGEPTAKAKEVSGGGKSPGAGLVVILAALAVAAVGLRRRA